MDIRQKIGHAVCNARLAAGKTQQELAEYLGVTSSTVSRLEAGRFSITAERLVDVAQWLKVAPAELLPMPL